MQNVNLSLAVRPTAIVVAYLPRAPHVFTAVTEKSQTKLQNYTVMNQR